MVTIRQNLVSASKYGIKCPYSMNPQGITIHNTANNAPAENEIAYMIRNNNEISFHYAVDDKEIVQGIPDNRNAWHAGDGGNGTGNRTTISVEICYSTGDKAKFEKAQENAAEFTAYKLKEYGWDISKVYTHQHWNGKHCPHRTLDEYGWDYFLNLVRKYLGEAQAPAAKPQELYRVRKTWADVKSQIGAFANLENAKKACKTGYTVFNSKGEAVYPAAAAPVAPAAPAKKSNAEIAQEVMAGKWGNGGDRKARLTAAGYDYNAVQAEVNKLVNGGAAPAPARKSNTELAQEVLAGKWGNGADRAAKLRAAGYDYDAVQAEVNRLAGASTGYRVQVTADALNVRAGAGMGYRVNKVIRYGQIYTIVQESNGWGKLGDGSGWVSLAYVKKV